MQKVAGMKQKILVLLLQYFSETKAVGCQQFGGRTGTEETGRANVTATQRPMQSKRGAGGQRRIRKRAQNGQIYSRWALMFSHSKIFHMAVFIWQAVYLLEAYFLFKNPVFPCFLLMEFGTFEVIFIVSFLIFFSSVRFI